MLSDTHRFCEFHSIENLLIDPNSCTVLLDYNQECRRKAEFARILPPIITSKFTTRKSFSFKYGKVEIRAKLPNGDWLYPRRKMNFVSFTLYNVMSFFFSSSNL